VIVVTGHERKNPTIIGSTYRFSRDLGVVSGIGIGAHKELKKILLKYL